MAGTLHGLVLHRRHPASELGDVVISAELGSAPRTSMVGTVVVLTSSQSGTKSDQFTPPSARGPNRSYRQIHVPSERRYALCRIPPRGSPVEGAHRAGGVVYLRRDVGNDLPTAEIGRLSKGRPHYSAFACSNPNSS
jgi:hypothetical protein